VIRRHIHRARRFWSSLGPGVITGAADDDPSGIATYSIAGAQLGTTLLWTALLTWPLMAAVQTMCARIGMVTGRGLVGALSAKLPRLVVMSFATALLVANTINVGADLSGMADAAELFTSINSHFWVVGFGVLTAWATIRFQYLQIAYVLKWLSAVLFAYVVVAFRVGPDWSSVLRATFIPTWPTGSDTWAALVAILGTTISPYLFFWQAAQEVEEERALGRVEPEQRQGATPREILRRKVDVGVGTFFSNLVMYFIILTAALTLHAHGLTRISTSREAAEALRPLAGDLSAALYAAGVIGVGVLAIPTLTCSAAYALAETFGWRQGLSEPLRGAPAFYGVVVLSTTCGISLDFFGINPLRALFWTAVINGLLAPFLLVGILYAASDSRLMQSQPSSRLGRAVVLVTTVLMVGAAVGMFLF
jgi:NRAMP (natural resistance-associated macrophage protein)-like metal ion transporter